MDALTEFGDRLNVPDTAFPTLGDFDASSTSEALKWTDLVQFISARSSNTLH